MPLLLLTIPLLLGVTLLVLGIRGRRINTHPTCRKCRYDLHALASPTICPECGSELAKPHAIRIGVRQRRKGAAIAGSFMLALAILLIAGQITLIAMGPKANAYKPVWMLLYEAHSATVVSADAALGELQSRLLQSKLSADASDEVIAQALAYQSDRSLQWRTGWGDVIEAARSSGLLPDQQWLQYAKAAIQLTLVPRARIEAGQPIAICPVFQTRLAKNSVLSYEASIVETFDEDWPHAIALQFEHELQPTTRQRFGITHSNSFESVYLGYKPRTPNEHQQTGRQSIELHINIVALDTSMRNLRTAVIPVEGPIPSNSESWDEFCKSQMGSWLWPPTKAIRSWNQTHTLSIEVLPEDTPSVALISAPDMAAALKLCLASARIVEVRKLDAIHCSEVRFTVEFPLDLTLPTYASVLARSASGNETTLLEITPAPRLVQMKRTRTLSSIVVMRADFAAQDGVTLILRPNPQRAARTVDITEIFGEEITIDNVPIDHPTP